MRYVGSIPALARALAMRAKLHRSRRAGSDGATLGCPEHGPGLLEPTKKRPLARGERSGSRGSTLIPRPCPSARARSFWPITGPPGLLSRCRSGAGLQGVFPISTPRRVSVYALHSLSDRVRPHVAQGTRPAQRLLVLSFPVGRSIAAKGAVSKSSIAAHLALALTGSYDKTRTCATT